MRHPEADFDAPDLAAEWKRSISDDLGITNVVVRRKQRIVFAPGALVASPEDQSPAQIKEFLTRQVAINRASHKWMFPITSLIFGWCAGVLLLGLALLALRPSPVLTLAGAVLVLPSFLQTFRAWMMDRFARVRLPTVAARPAKERRMQLARIWLMPWFTLWVYWHARRLKTITWRGRTYALRPGHIEAVPATKA